MSKGREIFKNKICWTMKSQVEYHQKEERNSGRRRARDFSPGGGLGKFTDRDQRSWVFLPDRKKYFHQNSIPKKMLENCITLKNWMEKLLWIFVCMYR